jgi:septal ring factor EnvC (AmiA/AmiB activator)
MSCREPGNGIGFRSLADTRLEGLRMLLFLRRILLAILETTEPSEVASLKKKITKQQKAIDELEECKRQLEADVIHLRSELNASISDSIEMGNSFSRDLREEKATSETLRERNRALLEKQDSLELELAESKATIILNTKEKAMMASLHSLLQERVNAAIAATADSYGPANRSRQPAE